jgi:hypothetical protein
MNGDKKPEEYGLVNTDKTKLIFEETPEKYIQHRPGRGGKTFDYVATGYVIDRLNKIFNYMWSFEVKEKSQNQSITQVQVLGKLTGYIVIPGNTPIVQAISKEQWGGSDVKKNDNGLPIDIGDDFKAATSDALKKCASLFGIASDIYWKGGNI